MAGLVFVCHSFAPVVRLMPTHFFNVPNALLLNEMRRRGRKVRSRLLTIENLKVFATTNQEKSGDFIGEKIAYKLKYHLNFLLRDE